MLKKRYFLMAILLGTLFVSIVVGFQGIYGTIANDTRNVTSQSQN